MKKFLSLILFLCLAPVYIILAQNNEPNSEYKVEKDSGLIEVIKTKKTTAPEPSPQQEIASTELTPADIAEVDKTQLQVDNRHNLPLQLQFSVENLYYWGASLGYHMQDWFMFGVDYHFLVFQDKVKRNIKYDSKATSLNANSDLSFNSKLNGNFGYYKVFARAYPFISSGFFLQLASLNRLIKQNINIYTADFVNHSQQLSSDKVATAKIVYPTAFEFGLGWNWVSNYGFSISTGLELNMSKDADIEVVSEKLKDGNNIFSSSERDSLADKIENKLPAYKRVLVFFFGFGKNF